MSCKVEESMVGHVDGRRCAGEGCVLHLEAHGTSQSVPQLHTRLVRVYRTCTLSTNYMLSYYSSNINNNDNNKGFNYIHEVYYNFSVLFISHKC